VNETYHGQHEILQGDLHCFRRTCLGLYVYVMLSDYINNDKFNARPLQHVVAQIIFNSVSGTTCGSTV
jgi:hypothetical protein